MKFYTDRLFTETIEINTLAELRAFALGGTGAIQIEFVVLNEETGEKMEYGLIRQF